MRKTSAAVFRLVAALNQRDERLLANRADSTKLARLALARPKPVAPASILGFERLELLIAPGGVACAQIRVVVILECQLREP